LLTGETTGETTLTNTTDNTTDNTTTTKTINRGGRSKGSTDKAKRTKELNFVEAKTEATRRCIAARDEARAANKPIKPRTYHRIIAEVEENTILPPNKRIKYNMVKPRMLANNPEGISPQRVSPIAAVEPLICDFCIQLARIGEALTKYEIFELAEDLIRNSIHAEAYIKYCKRRHIKKDWDKQIVGEAWYRKFMKRYETKLKRAKCKVIDNNRRTYCTYENFSNMYNAVYENMVDAGVAIKLEEETMFDKDGNKTTDPSKMHGRPTKYKLIKPERCVYVDETGCNTNCKNDGQIGGQRLIMGCNQKEGGRSSALTDLHFTVLAFTSGTGEPIMCAVILKSEKKVEELPMNWKLGIDATRNVTIEETENETY
jgi:hypothetical protein